jgi:hypothetical protein
MLAAYPGRRVDIWNIEMRIAGAMASVTFQYEITKEGEGPSFSEAGLGTAVLERRGGLWRIVHLQWSTGLGSRGSA